MQRLQVPFPGSEPKYWFRVPFSGIFID